MADPATVGLALQFSGVAFNVVQWLWKGLREVRRADEHVRALIEELWWTRFWLENSSHVLGKILNCNQDKLDSYDPVAELVHKYQTLIELIKGVKHGDDVLRFKWLRRADKCRLLTNEVKAHREKIKDMIIFLEIRRHPSNDKLDEIPIRLLRRNQGMAIESAERYALQNMNLLQLPPTDSIIMRRHSSGPPNAPTSYLEKPFIGPRVFDWDEACIPKCRCYCHHAQRRRHSTQLIRAGVPPILGRAGQMSFSSKCSIPECKATQCRRGQFTYSFPARLLHKVMTVSLMYEGLKLKSVLKVPSYIPEFSDVIKYAVDGNLAGIQRLFSARRASPNDTGIDGWTVLHNAAYNGRTSIVHLLISQGANQEALEVNNRKAPHFAMIKRIKKSATQEDKILVAAFDGDVQKEFCEDFRLSPIHICALHLQENEENEEKDNSPLLAELLRLVTKANKLVIKTDNSPTNQDWSDLISAYTGRSPLFTDIINMFKENLSRLPISNKDHQKLLLDLRNEPDAHGWTPLHWTAYAGRFPELKTLVEDGATTGNLTTSRRNILHHAAESGDGELLGYIFQERKKFDATTMNIDQQDLWGETPLHIASTRSSKCVLHLIEQGARLDLVQADHESVLHFASQAPEEELEVIVDLLTQKHPSLVNMEDKGGRTPLFGLLRSVKCVDLLLNRKADANARDHQKRSLLHEACSRGYHESMKSILEHCERSLITRKDCNGSTPLATAFECCTPESAECAALILACEDIKIEPRIDNTGWTLLHHAARLGDLRVLNLVLSRFNVDQLIGNCSQSLEHIVLGGWGEWEGDFKSLLETFGEEARWSSKTEKKNKAVSKGETFYGM